MKGRSRIMRKIKEKTWPFSGRTWLKVAAKAMMWWINDLIHIFWLHLVALSIFFFAFSKSLRHKQCIRLQRGMIYCYSGQGNQLLPNAFLIRIIVIISSVNSESILQMSRLKSVLIWVKIIPLPKGLRVSVLIGIRAL